MKISIIAILMLFVNGIVNAQQVNWANAIKTYGISGINDQCLDNEGNIYITGLIGCTINADCSCKMDNKNYSIQGYTDAFVAKLHPNGKVAWFKLFGNPNINKDDGDFDSGDEIYYDSITNSILVSGSVNSHQNNALIEGNGSGFLIKLDTSGTVRWAESFTSDSGKGGQGELVTGMQTDAQGNIEFTLGVFEKVTMKRNGKTLDSLGTHIVKFDANGNFISTTEFYPNCIVRKKTTTKGHYYIGEFWGNTTIKDTPLLCGNTKREGVFFMTDLNLNLKKLIQFKSNTGSYFSFKPLEVNDSGDIYMAGNYIADLVVEMDTLINKSSSFSGFVLKLDTEGNKKWLTNFRNNSGGISSLSVCLSGNKTFIANSYFGELNIGSQQFNSKGNDVYKSTLAIFELTENGNTSKQVQFEATRLERPHIISNLNKLYVSTSLGFTNFTIGNYSFSKQPPYNTGAVIAQLNDDLTSISELQSAGDKNLNIYSNPSNGLSTINLPASFSNSELELKLFNQLGQLVEQKSLPAGLSSTPLNLQQQAKGTYTVQISNGLETYTGKVVFE